MNFRTSVILSIIALVNLSLYAEEVMTQAFTSNTDSDWQPLIPTSKSSAECYSVTNDCTFKFENVAQSANGKYLILYPDGMITLPSLDGKISKIEICLYDDQPFSSLCNLAVNNQDGNRERYLEVDARDSGNLNNYIAFPYDLSVVYPEDNTIFSITTEKKIYITGIRITYAPNTVEPIAAPTFTVPEWINEDNYFSHSFTLTISTSTANAELFYSYDNSLWTLYNSPIEITESCTISAKAVKNGRESDISSISFTRFQNVASSIEEMLKIGQYALSEIDDNGKLVKNPNGNFVIDTTLQIIAHYDNRIFVSDNSDSFHNCIVIICPESYNDISDGGIIEKAIEGYFVMINDMMPALYTESLVEYHFARPEVFKINDIIDNPEKYINKYVALKEVIFNHTDMRLTHNNKYLAIDNLFDIEIPNESSTDVEGIITYSENKKCIVIAPTSFDGYNDIRRINIERYRLNDFSALPDDATLYDLNGIIRTPANITPGIFIVHRPGQQPHKVIITD